MKKILILFATLFCMSGCNKDDTVIRDKQGVNRWIYKQVADNYLWAGSIPAQAETDLLLYPADYFTTQLVHIDPLRYSDLYSRLKYTGSPENDPRSRADDDSDDYRSGFGFNYWVMGVGPDAGDRYIQLLYVIPGSPAGRAGLKRGDCIGYIDGMKLDAGTDISGLFDKPKVTFAVIYPEQREVTIEKGSFLNTPVVHHSIINPVDGGTKTGYLFYNRFAAGENDRFFNELKNVFMAFRSAGIKSLILDLRYNGGGELQAARQLCSLIVPPQRLGDILMYQERAESYGNPAAFEKSGFVNDEQVRGANAGIRNLYVIVRGNTASASELLIHCLKPHFSESGGSLTLIGATTYGKNVGGRKISDTRYEWVFDPLITLRIYDKYKVSGYESGIEPDYPAEEIIPGSPAITTPSGINVRQIGNMGDYNNENMLRVAASLIYGTLPTGRSASGGQPGSRIRGMEELSPAPAISTVTGLYE